MSSYREELCVKDQRGIPVFSPLCIPERTIDESLTYQVNETHKFCEIPSVMFPTLDSNNTSLGNSSKDWFSDPSYAQRIAAGSNRIAENASLQLYHRQKTIEKNTSSLLQTL